MHVCIIQSDKDSREDIMKVFDLFDQDGKGNITVEDLKRVAEELGEEMTEVITLYYFFDFYAI